MRSLLTTPVGWSLSVLILFWLVQTIRRGLADRSLAGVGAAARQLPPRSVWIVAWLAMFLPATPLAARALTGALQLVGPQAVQAAELTHGSAPDVVVVFAGGMDGDPVPGAPLSDSSRERLNAALMVARSWPDLPLLISGGSRSGARITAGMRMAEDAESLGFPRERIWLEKNSRTTRENATRTAEVLAERFPGRRPHVVLVTSDTHMARSLASLRRAGYDATAHSAGSPSHGRVGPKALLPSSAALNRSTMAIHEFLGLALYTVRGWLAWSAPGSPAPSPETQNAPG